MLHPTLSEVPICAIVTNAAEVRRGMIFVALSPLDYVNNYFTGTYPDSYCYLEDAMANGAAACMVRRDRVGLNPRAFKRFSGRLIVVDDALVALQRIAKYVFEAQHVPLVAVTGSAGKTSVKEFISSVLTDHGLRVLKNYGNMNNGLGLPLTVLRLLSERQQDVAVLEMGMSMPGGEIDRLCSIAKPNIGVVLNVLPVHLEKLSTIENIAAAKEELVKNIVIDGAAVLNADDARVMGMRVSCSKRLTFGLSPSADVRACGIAAKGMAGFEFELSTPSGSAPILLRLFGRHNIGNALAAAAVGTAMGIPLEGIAASLNTLEQPGQRGVLLKFKDGFGVIDDSYNSNPAALMSAVESLTSLRGEYGRIWVVAGEMAELGGQAREFHEEVGRQICRAGIDKLSIVGSGALSILDAAIKERPTLEVDYFDSAVSAAKTILGDIRLGDLVLIKASRSVGVERIVESLRRHFPLAA